MNKSYRYFYHFLKAKNAMSVHFRGVCLVAQNVIVKVPCETKWQKKQPRLIMRGFAKSVEIKDGTAYIE